MATQPENIQSITDAAFIPFTQYMLPNGRRQETSIEVDADVATKARELIAEGLCFECEVLTTGSVSLTITDPEEGDLDIRIHANGPGIREAVEDMVREFDLAEVRAAMASGEF